MSSLTKCNYCVLQMIKRNNPGKEVTVKEVPGETLCNLQVYVDGEGIGVWFQAISEECCC